MYHHTWAFYLEPPYSKPLLLFSGGMDSFMMWRLLRQPDCAYVELGHKYQGREQRGIANLQYMLKANGLPELSLLDPVRRLRLGDVEQPDGFIPFRNLLLTAVAVVEYSDHTTIMLGALKGEFSRDKSGRFFGDFSRLLTYLAGRPIAVKAPFRNLTKSQLVALYLKHYPSEADLNMLKLTVACYNKELPDGVVGCGVCLSCFRRWVAMVNNGIEEAYLIHPAEWQIQRAREFGWLSTVSRMREAPLSEWGNIVWNNLDAARALRQWEQRR